VAYQAEQHKNGNFDGDWYQKILPLRQQAEVINRWLALRLDTVLPNIMKREDFDMWIVACREYNEDPVFISLIPEPGMSARRLTVLVFHKQEDGTVQRFVLARAGIGGTLYQPVWNQELGDQWANLRAMLEEKQPQRIGINVGHTFAFGDGLSHALHEEMIVAMGETFASRCASAERLAVGWLEERTFDETVAYEGIMQIAHGVIAEAFSSRIIHPGVTTAEDVVWWIRQRFVDLGLKPWFQPSVSIQRQGAVGLGSVSSKDIIMPGDLLHCDVGFGYLRLNTDTQQNAYVLRRGEVDAPQGLKDALKAGNRLQDIVRHEMQVGRTGNEILKSSREKAIAEGLKPCIYNHPIGYHGHGAGPTIGLFDMQEGVPGRGDYPLFNSTCHALELNVKYPVAEWDDQEVTMALEQTILIRDKQAWFLDGRQESFHLIR